MIEINRKKEILSPIKCYLHQSVVPDIYEAVFKNLGFLGRMPQKPKLKRENFEILPSEEKNPWGEKD